MYICNDCYNCFDYPKYIKGKFKGFNLPESIYCCPRCGSDDFEEYKDYEDYYDEEDEYDPY